MKGLIMTAYDGNSRKVSVFFDSWGSEILVSLSDEPEDQADGHYDGVVVILPQDVEQIVDDLLTAYYIRTGERLKVYEKWTLSP